MWSVDKNGFGDTRIALVTVVRVVMLDIGDRDGDDGDVGMMESGQLYYCAATHANGLGITPDTSSL